MLIENNLGKSQVCPGKVMKFTFEIWLGTLSAIECIFNSFLSLAIYLIYLDMFAYLLVIHRLVLMTAQSSLLPESFH